MENSQREERKKQQQKLKKVQLKVGRSIQKQTQEMTKLKRLLKGLQGEARKTEDHCENAIVGVIDSLQSTFESLRRTIKAQQEEAAARGECCLKSQRAKLWRLRSRKAELQRLAQLDNAAFLKQWPKSQRLCENVLGARCDTWVEPHLQFELTKRTMGEFEKQLMNLCKVDFFTFMPSDQQEPERCSKGNTSSPTIACPSGLPGVHDDLTVEPRTRGDFLQYACSLTFDVTTAHEDLLVSADGREVRLHGGTRPAHRHPDRFMRRKQLLCRQALRAPRCYYEVEVEGDHAEIALAYRGIDRKSLSVLSAFGGSDRSWSLDRSKFYSVSHGGASVRLGARPAHKKIGVYLQLREGLLSFYEVADGMMLLYRVEASFTEPLYPGFWLGEKCCIRICDL